MKRHVRRRTTQRPQSSRRFKYSACSALIVTVTVLGFMSAEAQRAAPVGEWRYYGGDAASTKYSPLDLIHRGNVGGLPIAWRWTSPDNALARANSTLRPGYYEDTPIFANGVLYTITGLGVIAAIDPRTGQTLWQYDSESWKAGRPPNLGFTHRGVAYWTDGTRERIIAGTHDAYIISIDAKTGKLDPAFGVNGRVDAMAGIARAERMVNFAINSTPVIVRNVIVHGANIPDDAQNMEAPRGDVSGYDVVTGKGLWTFHSIPSPGEFGNETWQNDSWSYTGNTNIWSLLGVDEGLGYVYLPFGTPTSDYYGGHRPGDNLFAESLVCLDATTGKRVWHFQAVHHGLWDWDFPAAPIMGQLTVAGRRIDAVMQVSKQGFVYVFDRKSGQPVWPIEERPVPPSTVPGEETSRTQPFPTKPPAFERQGFTDDDVIDFTPELKTRALEIVRQYVRGPIFTPPSEQGTMQLPSNAGGANWSGAAFDPETHMLYVPSITTPFLAQVVKPDPAVSNLRYRRGNAPVPDIDGLPIVKPPYSRLTAYDMNNGTIAWQIALGEGPTDHPLLKGIPTGPLGGGRGYVLLTKTLLFVTEWEPPRGRPVPPPPTFRAIDKATGAVIWKTALPLGPTGSPMTYLHQGKQYIVMAAGGGLEAEILAFGLPGPATR
jgi:glucose dehydrogenase